MRKFFSAFVLCLFVGCSNPLVFRALRGYNVWEIYTRDYALLWFPRNYSLSKEEDDKIVKKMLDQNLNGVHWSVTNRLKTGDVVKYEGAPLSKQRINDKRYSEKWIYPLAIVYFKGDKVANVEFREDEIDKLRKQNIPVETIIRHEIPK